jgi:hypothetical protein
VQVRGGITLTLGKIFVWGVRDPHAQNSTTGGLVSALCCAVEVQTWTDTGQMSGMLLEKGEGLATASAPLTYPQQM